MNFDMAGEIVEMEDIPTTTVRVADDVASASLEERSKRRGIAGMVYCLQDGRSQGRYDGRPGRRDGHRPEGRRLVPHRWAWRLLLARCPPPAARPSASRSDEMEIGMGIHGEPGIRRGPLRPADEIAEEMLAMLLADMPLPAGDRVSVLCNSLGATPARGVVHRLPLRGEAAGGDWA